MLSILDNVAGSLRKSAKTRLQRESWHRIMIKVVGDKLSLDLKDVQSGHTFSDELFSSQPRHVGANSRVTLRRITKTSRRITSGQQITLVQSSRMTTTRSWSGPCVISSSIDENSHAVFSLDLIDAIPTSSDLFGWVNNLDAFIKDNDIRFDETQIASKDSEGADKHRDEYVSGTSEKSALDSETNKECDQNPTSKQGASGSELFGVCHLASFSHKEASL